MTVAAAETPGSLGGHTRGMAAGLGAGLAAVAFVALLPDEVAHI